MSLSFVLPSHDSYQRLAAWHGELTAFRRDLHAHPELGFEEVRTAGRVAQALRVAGVDEVHTGIGKTGVVGVVRGRCGDSGRMIGLRADMDALPIAEENEFGWRSTAPGRMHGCGHDGHTTMLIGAARHLAATRAFDGTAVLIFQPGEEGCGGAQAMLADGLFSRFPVDEVFALHNWPQLPAGVIGLNPGSMMASSTRLEITIDGRGGHGAHPYSTVDPVMIAGQVIVAAQSVVARNVNPVDSAVVSLCALHAGDVGLFNAIPGRARLIGTVRTLRPDVQRLVQDRLATLVEAIAAGFGARATVQFETLSPATVNSRAQALFAADVAASLVGRDRVVTDLPPSMGAEDFSYMLCEKPGAYLRIGQGGEGACHLHSSRYDFNDDILPLGAALLAALAERAMPLSGADARHD